MFVSKVSSTRVPSRDTQYCQAGIGGATPPRGDNMEGCRHEEAAAVAMVARDMIGMIYELLVDNLLSK
jgi:hypothetical protein